MQLAQIWWNEIEPQQGGSIFFVIKVLREKMAVLVRHFLILEVSEHRVLAIVIALRSYRGVSETPLQLNEPEAEMQWMQVLMWGGNLTGWKAEKTSWSIRAGGVMQKRGRLRRGCNPYEKPVYLGFFGVWWLDSELQKGYPKYEGSYSYLEN